MRTPTDRSLTHAGTRAGAAVASSAVLDHDLIERLDAERRAIGREIHDELGGALAAIQYDLAWIGRHSAEPGILARVEDALRMLREAVGVSQRLTRGLRAEAFAGGLVEALRSLCQDVQRRTGIEVDLQASLSAVALPAAFDSVVFRVLQEALTNATRHAACSHVEVALSDRAGVLTLEVADDGVGLAPDAWSRPGAFGLLGMRERAQLAGGWLDVATREAGGTLVSLSIPLDPVATSDERQELST